MDVTWIGHACILVQTPQGNLITDPWLVDPCLYQVVVHAQQPSHRVQDLPPIDVICITHPHYDHFDPRTLRHLPKSALVIIPPSPVRRLEAKLRNLGFTRIQSIPYWRSHEVCGLKVTVVPSVGIPEECSFAISDGESTIFHAADSIYEPNAARLRAMQIDLAFLPFSGWDVNGILGVDVEYQWQPNWEEEAKRATSIGARYIIPASCDQFWAPSSLQWLNDRTHPGKTEDFVAAIAAYRTQHPDVSSEAVPLTPGSTWNKRSGFHLAPVANGPITVSELSPPATSVPMEKLVEAGREYARKRRRQLLRSWHTHPYGVTLLLASPYTLHLTDIDGYLRLHLAHPSGVYALPKRPQSTLVSLASQNLYDLFTGKADAEMLVMGSHIQVAQKRSHWDLILVYALEYLLVMDDYSSEVAA